MANQPSYAAGFDAMMAKYKKPSTQPSSTPSSSSLIAPVTTSEPAASTSSFTEGQLSPDGTMKYSNGGWLPTGNTNTSASTTPATTGSTGQETVSDWYQNYAGRQGETEGLSYWQGRLNSGEDYNTVLNAFKSAAVDPTNVATAVEKGYYNQNYADQDAPPVTGMLQGAQAYGYTPTGYTPAAKATVQGYAAPTQAQTSSYDAVNQVITPDQLSSDRMAGILATDSPYMQQARYDGMATAAQRGLLDSSLSAEAAEAAAIREASPFALQEADAYGAAAANYANAVNRASEFGAQEENIAALQTNQQQDTANRFNADSENLANREYTQSQNNASQFDAAAINQAGQLYASAQNSASITNANNELSLALRQMQDDISTYSTDIQRATALDNLGLNLFNTAINSGVFNNPEAIAGYFNTVAGIFPDLGIQMVGQAASVDSGVVI